MRKTLATVLLGTTLLTGACSKRYDRAEAVPESPRSRAAPP